MKLNKILAATDLSRSSERAITCALDLALAMGARLTVLHAYHIPSFATPDGSAILPGPATATEIALAANDRLREFCARVCSGRRDVEWRTVEGPSAQVIVNVARDEGFDLVVLGTHGRTGVRHLLLGSVAERVVRTSSVAVLTVRSAAPEPTSVFPEPPLP
jgi:nucleotide-binding universal stress UspA family protein